LAGNFNKVFNIGLNRAGTTSLSAALDLLGVRTIHYRHKDTRLFDHMRANQKQGRPLLDRYDPEIRGFSDFAGHYFFATLDRQYPRSKFILTVREMDAWLESRAWKVGSNQQNKNYRYGFREVNKDGWRKERERYEAQLDRYFANRPGDYMQIDIAAGEGWDQLCSFLDLEPPGKAFPHRHLGASRARLEASEIPPPDQ
jgi:hypothetical protein